MLGAGRELGDIDRVAWVSVAIEPARRAFGEVAAVTGLPFVVDVSEHGTGAVVAAGTADNTLTDRGTSPSAALLPQVVTPSAGVPARR